MTGPLVAAIDVGGTAVKAALVTSAGVVGDVLTFPVDHLRGRPDMVDEIVRICRLTVRRSARPVDAVGLVVPGIVNPIARLGVSSMLLGWHNVPFGPLVESACGVPVAVGHDVRCAARAEFREWADGGLTDALFVTVGTGIGAAALVGGQIRTGGNGFGGEIAHLVVDPSGPTCPCGKRGCVEVISAGPAIAAAYAAADGRQSDVEAVAAAARSGDLAAAKVWHRAAAALGLAIAIYAQIMDPEIVIIGGGVAAAGELLLGPTREVVRSQVSLPVVPQLARSRIVEGAGIFGAALIAREMIGSTKW